MTVVDSTSFLDEVRVADYLEDRGMEAQEGDTRTIADLLVTQASKEKAPAVRRASTAGGRAGVSSLCRRFARRSLASCVACTFEYSILMLFA